MIEEAVTTVILALGGVLVYAARQLVTTYLKPTKLAHVQELAAVAVRGAEQVGDDWPLGELGGPEKTAGALKLDLATKAVNDGARKMGVKLSDPEVYAAVHAALRDMQAAES